MRVLGGVAVVGDIGSGDILIGQLFHVPGLPGVRADRLFVVFDDPVDGQTMVPAIFDAFVGHPGFGGHLPHEAPDPLVTTRPLGGEGRTQGDRKHAGDNGGGENAVLREAEGNGASGHDLGFYFGRRHALEEALVVAAPGTKDPVLRADLAKDGDDRLLVAVVEMNGGTDFGRIEFSGDIILEGNEIMRSHRVYFTWENMLFQLGVFAFPKGCHSAQPANRIHFAVVVLPIKKNDLGSQRIKFKGDLKKIS